MNLYDVLAGQGTTHFERLFSQKFAGGGKTQTLTGQPPLSFKSNGKPLISWSMLGNGRQTGTPSPQNIVPFDGTGERTGNLVNPDFVFNSSCNNLSTKISFPYSAAGNRKTAFIYVEPLTTYTFSSSNNDRLYIGGFSERKTKEQLLTYTPNNPITSESAYVISSTNVPNSFTFTTDANTKMICIYYSLAVVVTDAMLNLGSTAPSTYIPYGWQIPLTCAGQTSTVNLGQVSTVRRIKKLVLTGEETYTRETAYDRFITAFPNAKIKGLRLTQVYCTHFLSVYDGRSLVDVPNNSIYSSDVANNRFFIKTTEYTTAEDFKSYLADQYAAGTPVTVWYVLATPETGIVNEPLCKIGDYADELSSTDAAVTIPTAKGQNTLTVETDLQPSEMTITYKV